MNPSKMPDSDSLVDQEQPFVSHLVELRQRLVRIVFAVLLAFVFLFPFANDIYTYLATPLMKHLPEGTSMIATDVASPFLTPFKLSLVLAFFITIPFTLYQVWGFVAPGLYRSERRLVLPLVASSTVLYYCGMAFAYFVVFPLIFGFFVSVAPEGVSVMTDIAKYLDFVLKLFFAFGVAFEVPVATVLLVLTGMTTPEALVQKRPYIIVGVFVVAMLLTPPDVISQTMLALPVWLLFEIGIVASRAVVRRRSDGEPGGEGPTGGGAGPHGDPAMAAVPASGPGSAAAAAGAGLAAMQAEAAIEAAEAAAAQSDDDEDDDWDEEDWDDQQGSDRVADQAGDRDAADPREADDPPGDWEQDPTRYTDEGFDAEMDLQDGGAFDDEPEPEPEPNSEVGLAQGEDSARSANPS